MERAQEPQEYEPKNINDLRRKAFMEMFSEMEEGYEDLLEELPDDYVARKEEILNSVEIEKIVEEMYTMYQNGKMTLENVLTELMNKAIIENDFAKAIRTNMVLKKVQARNSEREEAMTQEEQTTEPEEPTAQEEQEPIKPEESTAEEEQEQEPEQKPATIDLQPLTNVVDKLKRGYEDLLSPSFMDRINEYYNSPDLTKEDVKKAVKELEGKTLLDIYKEDLQVIEKQIKQTSDYKIKANLKVRKEQTIRYINMVKQRKSEIFKLNKMFKQKEEHFEDLVIDEYKYFKQDMFKLLAKDPNGLRHIMSEMSGMKLSYIYSKMLEKAQKLGQEDKAKDISEALEKIKQREEEIKRKEEHNKDYEKYAKDLNKKNERNNNNGDNKENKPYEKTIINVDSKNNKVVVCLKGKTKPSYEAIDNETIEALLRNGKEYKKDKNYRKEFKCKRRVLKKVDPVILATLIDSGDIETAKEYVNAFKNKNFNSIDVNYSFSDHTVGVPMKITNSYRRFAKKAERRNVATVKGLSRGPIGMLKRWSRANKAAMLESEKMKEARIARENAARDQEKNSFKDEMKKDAPTNEEQSETARKFKEKQKAQKRERKDKKTKTAEAVK